MNTVVVYHGSISSIEKIDVAKGRPYKDFGRGFYVTKSKSHATNLALRNKRIEIEIYRRPCEAYLHTFEMDMIKLSDFNVKEFPEADLEWVQFVYQTVRLVTGQIYFSKNEVTNLLIPKGQVEKL